jgi:hypothetical protein
MVIYFWFIFLESAKEGTHPGVHVYKSVVCIVFFLLNILSLGFGFVATLIDPTDRNVLKVKK